MKFIGKSVIPLLLLISLLFTVCSNGQSNDSNAVTTKNDSAVAAAEEAEDTTTNRANIKDTLPADLDFGGKPIKILYRGGFDSIEMNSDDITGDIVNDAVYERNTKVQERLNVQFEYNESGTATAQNMPTAITSSILAGSDEVDLIAWAQYVVLPLALQNMFCNLSGASYIDLAQPWWNNDYMSKVNIGENSSFFLMGDICLTALRGTNATFFNKQIYTNLFGSTDDFYQFILDGHWTIDKMYEYTEAAYVDLNGNGVSDKGDMFGMGATTVANTEHFAFSMGLKISECDSNGIPTIVVNNDRTVNIVEKMHALYYDNPGSKIVKDDNSFIAFGTSDIADDFISGRLLFMPLWLQTGDDLREMETDYGVIPFPKLNESQENYMALAHDTSSMMCIPGTTQAFDETCAVLEAMCAETYRTVTPAYYEVALKTKYTRDNLSSLMIDLIHDNTTTDFCYAYTYALDSIGVMMRTLVGGNQPNFAAYYAKIEASLQTKLEKLIALYE